MMLKHMLTPNGALNASGTSQHSRYKVANNTAPRNPSAFPLNVSALNATTSLNASKHSLCGNALISAGNKSLNGGLNISRAKSQRSQGVVNKFVGRPQHVGVKEMLVSLGLLCLVSLLLALISLIFLLKISPITSNDIRDLLGTEQLTVVTAEEYIVVYEVTLALCALTLSLNLCCLLVCAIQFLFAVKLVKSPHGGCDRTNKYLRKSSISRIIAIGGFFISIPVFLTGIILYTFIQFHSTPAIVTSVFIGIGIIFCGCAMVHNVFIWQKEKTNAVRELALQHHDHTVNTINTPHVSFNHSFAHSTAAPFMLRPSSPSVETMPKMHPREASGSASPGMPAPTLDMSSVGTTNSPHELSTLV